MAKKLFILPSIIANEVSVSESGSLIGGGSGQSGVAPWMEMCSFEDWKNNNEYAKDYSGDNEINEIDYYWWFWEYFALDPNFNDYVNNYFNGKEPDDPRP